MALYMCIYDVAVTYVYVCCCVLQECAGNVE